MRSARRRFSTFSLSFLDIMSCGFGAVVLIYLIIDHASSDNPNRLNPDQLAEATLLDEEIKVGEENKVRVRNALDEIDMQIVEAQGLASRLIKDIEDKEFELAAAEKDSLAQQESLERLRADIQKLQQQKIEAQENIEEKGKQIRRFIGEGDRQYLTGFKVGGKRTLVLVDASTSMLDKSVTSILRTRKLPDSQKVRAPKWRQVQRTVDWLAAQFPQKSNYQIYLFNEQVAPLIKGTQGRWLAADDSEQLGDALQLLQKTVPEGGSNLAQAFIEARRMVPPADNIVLITDGLPTLGLGSNPKRVDGRDRLRLYRKALDELPGGIPINVLLYPLEGDPEAAPEYWRLAINSRGSFLTPSADWP